MKAFSDKIFAGENVTSDEWMDYLKHAHHEVPGMTPIAFDNLVNLEGLSSYQSLAKAIKNQKPEAQKILDLACGDGHLISILDSNQNHVIEMTGVDMSKDELALAKKKTFKNRVHFLCETADKISEASSSTDVITCHMAFMLMSPLEPVVREILRILKPGGMFAAVVPGPSSQGSFEQEYASVRRAFIKEKYPNMAPNFIDARTSTKEGLTEILGTSRFEKFNFIDFEIKADIDPTTLWECFRTFYFISAMPTNYQSELKSRLEKTAEKLTKQNHKLELGFGMTLLTCLKRS